MISSARGATCMKHKRVGSHEADQEGDSKGDSAERGGPALFFGENPPVLYIWRLAQAITIDNRPIGTTAPRGSTIPPHFRESIGSMTNNSHNGLSATPAPCCHPSCSSPARVPFQPPRVIHDQIGSGNFTFTSQAR